MFYYFVAAAAAAAYRKLMTLFRHDGNLTLDMCKTILLCTRDLVRTTSTPNTIEEDIYVDAYKTLLQKIRERYVSECLNCESSRESADAAGKMLEPLVSISKEVTESRAKEKLKIDYLDTIKEAVRTGTAKLFAAYNAGFEWDNTDKVLKYSDVLSGTYTARIIPVLEMLGRVFGPDKTPALRAAVDSVETVLSTEVDRYIERLAAADPAEKSATSEMQGVQINVMKTIKALTALRAAVKEAAGGAAVHVEQGTGLIILWCRKSETLLKRWVESVVSSDKRERTNDESLCSTSPIDVSESVTQTVGQLGALEVEDPFVWTQASELLVTTVTYYIQLQSHIAVKYFGSTLSEDRKLDEVCLSLSNMEQGQMMLNDVISEVEGFVARWKTERAVPEDDTRTQITTDTIDTAVSDALIKSKAYINKPLTLVAEKAATEAAIPALTAARTPANTDPANEGTPSSSAAAASNGTSENNAASTAAAATTPQTPYSEQITSSIDDVLVKINERVSTRIFKKVLEAFFAAILEQIWAAAEPDPAGAAVGLNDPTVCASFMGILEDITAYFSAGLSAKSIEGNALYKRTHQLLLAYGLSTEELITIVRFSTASPPVPLEDKRFEGIKPVVVDSILKMRAKAGDKWAIAYQREGAGSENSSKVRAVLGLPPSELLIESKHKYIYIYIFFTIVLSFFLLLLLFRMGMLQRWKDWDTVFDVKELGVQPRSEW